MSLWNEKPNPTELWYPLAPWGIKELYFVKDMDAWLEKLKVQEDALRKINHDQFQEIGRLEKEVRTLHRKVINDE